MNETPNMPAAELFDAMVDAYETWAELLTARLAQVALEKASVRAGDSVLDIGGNGCFVTSGCRPRGEGYRYRSFGRHGCSVNPPFTILARAGRKLPLPAGFAEWARAHIACCRPMN